MGGHLKKLPSCFQLYHHLTVQGVLVIDTCQEKHHSTLLGSAYLNAVERGQQMGGNGSACNAKK